VVSVNLSEFILATELRSAALYIRLRNILRILFIGGDFHYNAV